MVSQAVILAAGKNERFWPLGNSKHKCMYEIMGKPILFYTIQELKKAGIKDIVIVISPKECSIQNYFGSGKRFGVRIQYAVQQEAKGMGDGLLSAKKYINDTFYLLNASSFECGDVVRQLQKQYKKTKGVVLSCTVTQEPWLYGILSLTGDKVTSLIEKPARGKEPGNKKVIGIYLLTKDFVSTLERMPQSENSLEISLDAHAKRSTVSAVLLKEYHAPSLKYPWHLFATNKFLMDRFMKKHRGKNVKIHKTAIIEGDVWIEDDVKVFEYAVIKGPCYIGKDSIIGTGALVRQYASLGEKVLVGFHTELKHCIVGNDVEFHNNYFGDSIIDDGCRFGAGTITANRRLDRGTVKSMVKANKVDTCLCFLGTIVGEHSKTGIHTDIMPGVKIGSCTNIGANSVVLRDVPDNTLFYTEFKQTVQKQLRRKGNPARANHCL